MYRWNFLICVEKKYINILTVKEMVDKNKPNYKIHEVDMNRQIVFFTGLIATAILLPELGFAEDSSKDLLEGKLGNEMKQLVDTLFGYPVKIAGVLAGSYGLLQSYVAASPKPLMMWGGVCLLTFFMPKVLKAFFAL